MDHNPEEILARQVNRKKEENRKTRVDLQIKETYKVRVVRNQKETQIGEVNLGLQENHRC